jgi:WD40 repeat protein
MKINPKIDEDYNKLINTQTDNFEIIKLYSQFVDGILCNEEKSEICQKNSKVVFYNKIEIHEKDYTNFDIEILNENINLPYIIISASKDHIGKIIDLSMNIIKIFGYSKNELIGKNINILIPKLFHKIHDLLLIKQFENDNLKLFDELNKKKYIFLILSKRKYMVYQK